jgi:hypothetical protein
MSNPEIQPTQPRPELPPDLIEFVKKLVPEIIEVEFEELFEAYQQEGDALTELDLIHEILQAGLYQFDSGMVDVDVVTIGIIAMAGPLGFA